MSKTVNGATRTIMLLGAGPMQIPIIQAAKAMALRVVVADPSPQAPGLRLADEVQILDLADIPGLLAVAKNYSVSGVLTFAADFPVPAVALLCQELGLAGLTPQAARASTSKKEMRRVFKNANVPSPASFPAATLDEARSALREVARVAPLAIFKPALSNGGRGVTQVPVDASGQQIASAFEHALSESRGDGMLVEEFANGPEYSVECVACDGTVEAVAVTDKLTTGAPHFVEIGHSQPAAVSPAAHQILTATAIAGTKALGIDWAGSHAEIRLTAAGPRVMEIAGRFGGGYINSHLVPLSTGIDLPRVAVLLALGEKPDLRPRHHRGAAMRFLTPAPGIVASVSGLETARRFPGVRVVEVSVQLGDCVKPLIDGSRRVGFVICEGSDAAEAVARAEAALAAVVVHTRVG